MFERTFRELTGHWTYQERWRQIVIMVWFPVLFFVLLGLNWAIEKTVKDLSKEQ